MTVIVRVIQSVALLLPTGGSIIVSSRVTGNDTDGDGRPDEFELQQGLDADVNDLEWTFLVYCCGDDVARGNRTGTILPEMWEFIEKLSWVGSTENITIVVQFDGSDQLYGNHQDMFWSEIPNNAGDSPITPTSTRRFLVGKDTLGWNTSLVLQSDCYNNTVVDLYDVTDWDPASTGKAHASPNWEANMADPVTLHEFISWGMDTFPSDHYCLYVDSHGDGVSGFGYDHRPDGGETSLVKDVLNLSDIEKVGDLLLQEEPPKRLDIVMLQSCLMGNMEFCYEFSRFAGHFVASENVMHITGNQDDRVLEELDKDPSWSPDRLAREYVYVEYLYSRDGITNPPWNIMDWIGRERLTFASLNTSFLAGSDMMGQISRFNRAMVSGVDSDPGWYLPHLRSSLSAENTDHFSNDFDYVQVDYYRFLHYWTGMVGPDDGIFPVLRQAAVNISDLLLCDDPTPHMIEYEKHDLERFERTTGVSIYLPFSPTEWGKMSSEYRNSSFDVLTGWSAVIDLLHTNYPPVVQPVDDVKTYPGRVVEVPINVMDLNDDEVEMSLEWTDAPFMVSLLPGPVISFNATEEEVGVYEIDLRFDDDNGSFSILAIHVDIVPFNIPPYIEDIPDLEIYAEVEFTRQLNVSDPNPNDVMNVTADYNGTGECWVDEELVLHLIPEMEDIGTREILISVTDNNGSAADLKVIVLVKLRNGPPEGPEEFRITIEAGDKYAQTVNYSDPDGDTISLKLLSNPLGWMEFSFSDSLYFYLLPTTDLLGSHNITIQLIDGRGGFLNVSFSILIIPCQTFEVLLPKTLTVRERELFEIPIFTDYWGNGTVDYEIESEIVDFIDVRSDYLKVRPKDGDAGTYPISIRTMVIHGSSVVTQHSIIVERNLSTIKVKIDVVPFKETYHVGDIVSVGVTYTGYNAELDLGLIFTVDGNTIYETDRSRTSLTLFMASDTTITVDHDIDGLEIDPVVLHVEEKDVSSGPSIFPLIFVGIVVLAGCGTFIYLWLRGRGQGREIEE